MIRTLLRHLRALPGLLLLLLALGAAHSAQASHLLGGEMTYKYLDSNGPSTAPLRYEITLTLYINCNSGSASPPSTADIYIYNQSNGAQVSLTTSNSPNATSGFIRAPYTYLTPNGQCITAYVPPGCPITGATQQPYYLDRFVTTVNLPKNSAGYYAYFSLGDRNYTIYNLNSSLYYNLTLYASLAPTVYNNSSPTFATSAVAVICANDTSIVLNNAVDTDGDRLVYTFGTPYTQTYPSTFTPPPGGVTYSAGHTATTPLGAAPSYANINLNTGISKYYATGATVAGRQYAVAVDVKEYRTLSNGTEVLIGTTRRDIQLIVGTCQPTAPPVYVPVTGSSSNYTIEAGGTLTIPITYTQANNHDLDLTTTSVLLDGAGGTYNATFAGNPGTLTYAGSSIGSATVSGTNGTVTGNFVFSPTCLQARATPYDVTVMVQDKGCAGKISANVLHITVVKPSGPTAIAGDAVICGLNTTHTYTSSGGTSPNVSWRLYAPTGGVLSSSTTNPINILWTTAGTYTLTARGVGQFGCLTDSVSKTIQVFPAATVTVTGNQTICAGSSTVLTPSGSAPYTITDGTTTQTGNGPFTLSPTQTTIYTITGSSGAAGCAPTSQVTVTVNPLPAANAGAAVSTCSGVPATIGAAPVTGSTYSWTPTTGLSSPTAANPTVTITSNQTYTLTETSAVGCTNSNSVTVTVVPPPTATPGAAVAICSGGSATLGAAPVAGYTYSWSPATGLSSTTDANPTVTLTNTTGAATTTTYTLTVTSAGCSSMGTVAVTVNPIPVASAGSAVAFCSGGSATLGAAPVTGLTYSWSPATGLSSATAANPTVTLTNTTGAATTTTYTLTVTNAGGCTGTSTVAVTVNPLPTANAGAAVAFCSGGSATLGAAPVTGLTYSWSPATGLSSPTAANPTVTLTNTTGAATTTTYTLTVTNAGGCVGTGTVAVTVNPIPVAVPGSAVAICSGSSATLGAAPVTGLTYSWSPATGLSSTTAANPTVTLTNTTGAATTTTYTLTVTSAGGCTSTGTVAVTVSPQPTANAGSAVAFCSGGSATLGAAPVTGLTYSWSPATGLSSATAANPTVTLTNTTGAATTTTYTLTVTNAGGCTGTSTVAVTVNPLPTANAGAAVAFCSGGSATLGAAPVAGLTYSWSPATGLSSATAANPTVTLTNTTGAATTTTYTLTVTSAAGCVGTGTVAVTVSPLPTANAGAAVAFCSGGSATLGAAPVAGLTYSWSPATGLSSATAANPTVTLTNTTGAATTTTYTLTVTNAGGCVGTGTVAVTVSPLPTANAGAAVAFCSGGSATLGAAPVAGLTYSWSPATGLSSATAANPTVTLTNTTGAATTTTYTLTVTNAGGCTNTGTVAVTVNPIPVAVPGAAIAICSGGTGSLGGTAVAGLTYSWSPATGLSSATAANPTVTLTNTTSAATTATYTLTVTSAAGCTSTGTVVVTVNPLPTAVPGANIAFCSGGTGSLGGPAVAGLTYSWSPATGLSSATDANPTVTLTNTTGTAITATYTLTVTSAAGCTGIGTVVVTVNPIPVAVPGAAVAICSGSTGSLGGPAVAGLTYSWSPATGLSSTTAANPTVTLTNTTSTAITATYTLTVTSATGCTSTGTVVVTVNPIPVAVPGAAVAICSGGSATLGAAPVTGLTYSWSPATGLSSATAANPTVTLTNTTSAATTATYTLTVTSAAGCTSTGTVVVTVNPLPTAVPGANIAFCSGGTGSLGGPAVAGLTYSWSPATGLSSATDANPTVTLTNTTSAATTTTYTLTVTNTATTCVSTGTVDVVVNPIPVAVPGAAIAICSGGTGSLGGTAVAGLTYSWSPATGLSSATAANPTVTLTNTTSAATTATYTLTVTSAAGCTSTGTVVVTVNPLPTAVPGANIAFCSGGTGSLGGPAVAGLTYSWSPATGLSSATAANPTVTLTNTTSTATTTTYTLTVTNTATTCTSTGTVDVVVNPIPVVVPGAAVAICSGGSATLGAAPVTGLTYSWSPATGLSSPTAANPTVTLTNTTGAAITTTYTLTVTSVAGCVGTGTVAVTVNPLPTAVPGAAIAFCSGGSGQIGAPAVAGYTYSWSPATGLSSATDANPTVTLTNTTNSAINQTYTLTVTSAAGCTSTGTVVVTVNALPVVFPGAPVTICSGGTALLGGPAVSGYTYAWSLSTGLSSTTAANPTVTLTNTTGSVLTLTYALTVTNTATNCTNTGTVVVTVNSVVAPGTISASQTVCPGAAPAAFANVVSASGGDNTYAYQWESSFDNITWTAIPSANLPTYTPGPITVPTYFRRRVTSGACGTDVSNVVQLQLQQVLVSGVTLPTLAPQCPGATITFIPTPTNAGSSPTYIWYVNGVQVATTPTYTSSTLVQGDLVKVELTPTVGFCASGPATATSSINVIPVLQPAVTMSAKTVMPVCSGQPIAFSIDNTTNPGTAPQYQWQVNGVNVPGATAPTFTTTALQDGQVVTVVLSVTGPCGTLKATSTGVPVSINLTAILNAGPDKEIMEGDEVTLDVTANGTYPVLWTPITGLTFGSGGQLHPVASPTVTTTYTVSGGIGQCGSSSSVTVTVTPRLRIPSAFSPNGDGNDDTWQINNIEAYTNTHVTIFNRWGNKLFETTNYGRGNEWSGTINGSPAPIGTYYFIITLPNGKAYTGPLTIIY